MADKSFSVSDVIEWARSMTARGIYNENTSRLRVTALRQMASVLPQEEQSNIAGLAKRTTEIAAKWAAANNAGPETAKTYANRAKLLVEEFLTYQKDPLSFSMTRRESEKEPSGSGEPETTDSEPTTTKAGQRAPRARSEDAFPLPTRSYDELTKIIKAYALAPNANAEAISHVTGVPKEEISRTSGFLVSAGILNDRPREPTESGKLLGRALEHNLPTETERAWRTIVEQCEFLQKMVIAVRVRGGLDAESFRSHILYSAGVAKAPRWQTGARTIAEILVASGLLLEKDGVLKVAESTEASSASPTQSSRPHVPTQGATSSPPAPLVISPTSGHNSVTININLTVGLDSDPVAVARFVQKTIDALQEADSHGLNEDELK